MTLVLRRSRNLQILKLDFRLLPEKCYETCCHWTQMLMDRVEKEGLFELVVKGDKALDEGMEERVCRFESVSSLGLSTSFEPNKRIFEQEFPNLDRMEIVCGLEMVEPLNYYKFLERKNRKLRKVIFRAEGSIILGSCCFLCGKLKNDPKEKYGFTELLKERGTHMRSLEIKNSFLCESKFYRFDVAVLPKLRKISIDNCKGTSTCDMLLRATNCPQLREVYINNLKLTEPEVIEGIFMNCYEIREITLIFQRGDCTKTFNKGLNNIIAKIMRKYARFMPLPLCIFNHLKKISVSNLNSESIDLFRQINAIDYDVYSKFQVFEAKTGKRLL
ncbi:unnamed protein product [Moneuplotes crassus]|uniref:Uncharacterized protein n=1 Tax=Euplotes crassus TaxID=5936 RepID=A0AAD1XWS0_EUPCR|nr:unnamed protein product [Moneuplotes crassus]